MNVFRRAFKPVLILCLLLIFVLLLSACGAQVNSDNNDQNGDTGQTGDTNTDAETTRTVTIDNRFLDSEKAYFMLQAIKEFYTTAKGRYTITIFEPIIDTIPLKMLFVYPKEKIDTTVYIEDIDVKENGTTTINMIEV